MEFPHLWWRAYGSPFHSFNSSVLLCKNILHIYTTWPEVLGHGSQWNTCFIQSHCHRCIKSGIKQFAFTNTCERKDFPKNSELGAVIFSLWNVFSSRYSIISGEYYYGKVEKFINTATLVKPCKVTDHKICQYFVDSKTGDFLTSSVQKLCTRSFISWVSMTKQLHAIFT